MQFLGTERLALLMQVAGVDCVRILAKGLLLVFVLGLVSCSDGKPALNPAHGKVLYKDSPAAGVFVTFQLVGADDANSQPSTGYTEEDGSFEIVTGQDPGAPAGEYIVTMIWMQEV